MNSSTDCGRGVVAPRRRFVTAFFSFEPAGGDIADIEDFDLTRKVRVLTFGTNTNSDRTAVSIAYWA
jgi:hypothetical protein